MANRNTKPKANNVQERPHAPVATSFRFTPTQFRMMDRLKVVYANRFGKQYGRVDILKALLEQAWELEFRGVPYPTTEGDAAPVPAKKVTAKKKRK